MTTVATLLTGASSGIGLELAHLLAAEQQVLILVARREDRLQELAKTLKKKYGADVRVIAADLAAMGAAQQLVDSIHSQGLVIDTLINNAGFGENGLFADSDPARNSQMLHLNIIALTELTRLALPDMQARQHGRILNVASIVAYQPCPRFAIYAASKAYVLSFSEALHVEVADQGIKVTALCPGSTATEFHDVAQNEHARVNQVPKDSAADVALAAYKALNRGERSLVTGWINKPVPLMVRITPKSALMWAADRMARQEK
jgi:short-subunit dehydrogenase